MTKTLQLAMSKASKLPAAAQEAIGLDILDHLAELEELRAAVQVGIVQLDAGKGKEIDIDALLRRAHKRHGKNGKA